MLQRCVSALTNGATVKKYNPEKCFLKDLYLKSLYIDTRTVIKIKPYQTLSTKK